MQSVEHLLDKLGFKPNLIIECIVTTTDRTGEINVAPMGVKRVSSRVLQLDIFQGSKTLSNIRSTKEAVINVVNDVTVFYRALFENDFSQNEFSKPNKINTPYLKQAEAYIEVIAEDFLTRDLVTTVKLRPVAIAILKQYPRGFSRCDFAVLESLIHATRIKAFMKTDRSKTHELLELVKHYYEYVTRRCSEKPYREVMSRLLELIHSWMSEK